MHVELRALAITVARWLWDDQLDLVSKLLSAGGGWAKRSRCSQQPSVDG